MVWVSPDWVGWPVGEPDVVSALTAWARTGSVQMLWLANDYRAFDGALARLMRWRRDWAHLVRCLTPADDSRGLLPTMLIADQRLLVQCTDMRHGRGRISATSREIRQSTDWVDAVLQQSVEALPVTTLGI